jgi:hypothetical protein
VPRTAAILTRVSVLPGIGALCPFPAKLLFHLPRDEEKGCEYRVLKVVGVAHRLLQTYLAGESFAGQYIPYFGKPTDLFFLQDFALTDHSSLADALLKSQAFPNYPLKGIAIGNGWIDPKTQYQGYVDFAYEKGLIKQGSKVGLKSISLNAIYY